MQPFSFNELKELLVHLEHSPSAGYHRIYYQTQLKNAIAAYDDMGIVKYILFAPRYHKLIEKARSNL